MPKYLISFPAAAMLATGDELAAAGRDSRAVIEQAKAEGVYVFAGGIDPGIEPVRVSASGNVAGGDQAPLRPLDGGFAVFELPSREDAVAWAARLAAACRCDQELRVFLFDPLS